MAASLPAGLRRELEAHGAWSAYLFVHDGDAQPGGYPMLATFHGDALEFTTYRRSAKASRILQDSRVCMVLRSRPDEQPLAIAIWGHAEEVTEGEHLLSRPAVTPGPIAVPETMAATVADRLESGKRMVFRLSAERYRILSLAPELVGGGDDGAP